MGRCVVSRQSGVVEDAVAPAQDKGRPWLTIVSPIYGVANYLPDFLQSLRDQGDELSGVEVILVDDGSTDGSGDIADTWALQQSSVVKVIHQDNQGQSGARNTGMRAATGEWITFPDPDDILAPDYLREVREFIARFPDASALASHMVFYREGTGSIEDNHPLSFRFRRGNTVVDLDRFTDHFQLSLASSFLRLDEMRRLRIEGDSRVWPVGEDSHLLGRYMLGSPDAMLGLVDTAQYLYRKRADASSTLDSSRSKPEWYTDSIRYGLLDLVNTALASRGAVPAWLQTMMIYDLQWRLRPELSNGGVATASDLGVGAEFYQLLSEILEHVDPAIVEGFSIVHLAPVVRVALAHGFRGTDWHSQEVQVVELDRKERWWKLRYRYVGAAPVEQLVVNGRTVRTSRATRRRIEFAGQAVVWERIVWLPMRGQVRVELDGAALPVVREDKVRRLTSVRAADVDRMFGNVPKFSDHADRKVRRRTAQQRWAEVWGAQARNRRRVEWVKRIAGSRPVRRVFRDSWILMDRERGAQDNGVHLFRYLRRHERGINAWFVVRRDSEDFVRLRGEGFKRVVPYGSFLWLLLSLNARFLISSHADAHVHDPVELAPYGGARWKFVFLQHGVTKDDISRWLNGKPIRLFITVTRDEFEYVSGDESPFAFTRREVVRTGFPRHDRLVQLARANSEPSTLLVMPTWRTSLVGLRNSSGNRETYQGFMATRYAEAWSAFLEHPELSRIAEREGLRIVFMPHPNMAEYLPQWPMPKGVEVATYDDHDVQEMIADAAVMVTDYSSVAFDAAMIRRHVVYFQFDSDEVFGGGHTTRPGYYDYERDGFGPVMSDVDSAVGAVDDVLKGVQDPDYAERASRAFDGVGAGGSCARVVAEIRKVDAAMRWE